MKNTFFFIFWAVSITLSISCSHIWGDNKLGNNFSLLEGDCIEDRVIVYCSHKGICDGGMYVLPTYERHYNKEGKYAEYVEDAKSNDQWIVAKTYQIFEKKNYYWIIDKSFSLSNVDCDTTDCNEIIQRHVKGPFCLNEFNEMVDMYNIDIDFE